MALEALAAGLPLSSDLDVFESFLADGESALTPPWRRRALGEALARLAGRRRWAPGSRGGRAWRRLRLGRRRGRARGRLPRFMAVASR